MAKKEVIKSKEKNKENKSKKNFFKGFKAELKKVSWPTPKQLINNTTAVVVIVLITALIVIALDIGFEFINTKGVELVEKNLQEETITTDIDTEDQTNNEEQDSTTTVEEDNTTTTEDIVTDENTVN